MFYPSREAASWPPGDGFTRIDPGVNFRGIPEGCHSGGVYLSPDGNQVWKPLVGLYPVVTVNGHGFETGETREDECLEAADGLRSFPRNWRVEEAAGKRWIVRPLAIVIKTEEDVRDYMELKHIFQIEQDVRALNHRGWAVNDTISIAMWRGQRFVLDLSIAQPCKLGWSDDEDHVMRWLKECVNIPWVSYLRTEGRELLDPFNERFDVCRDYAIAYIFHGGYNHVYASRSRPMDAMWAPEEWVYVQGTAKDMQNGVHTWVMTQDRITQEKMDSLELTWAWSPWKT